jgi:signal transduction histidine kinase
MKPRTASRVAWSVGIVSIVLMAGGLVFMFVDRHIALPAVTAEGASWTFSNVLNVVVNMAVPILGIVLASRRPENRIGWVFVVAGFSLGLSQFGTSYGLHALVADPRSLPAGRVFAWVGNSIGLVAIGALAFLFLLFPTGHLRSARWRPAAWFVGGAFALNTATAMVFASQAWSDPFTQPSSGSPFTTFVFFALFLLPVVGSLAVSLTAVIVRFRKSAGDERLQLKWFATGAVLVFVTLVASIVTAGGLSVVASVLESLSFIVLFAAIGIAVLKYRLYEIDVVISKTVVYGVLAAFFTAVYVAVVVGIGTAVGSANNPFLTVLAATVIALAFNPVRARATRFANRIVYGKRASPYEVLSEFSERMAGTYSVEDVLPQMATILGEGTGARQARVWLRVGRELRPAASWGDPGGIDEPLPVSDGELPDIAGASRVVAVRHRDELLGALTVSKPPNEPLSVAEGKLVDDLAAQAGLVLRNVRLTEELRANLEELRASRQRLVTAQDEERRRLERNIHDGAQQQLVALAVKANLAGALVGKDSNREREIIAQLKAEATDALENLRDLARGIYPPLLADQGLTAALSAQARKAALPVDVAANGIGRYPQDAEAAVYFCILEALQNVAKYAKASRALIRLSGDESRIEFSVEDDGIGFNAGMAQRGLGLTNMDDRVSALGGTLDVRSQPGAGTTIAGSIPVT